MVPATAMVLFCKHQPYLVLNGSFVLGALFHPQILGAMGGNWVAGDGRGDYR